MQQIIEIIIIILISEQLIINSLAKCKKKSINKQFNLDIKDTYVKQRILSNLLWYEENAYMYRMRFILYSMISIVLSSSIPMIALWGGDVFGLKNKIIISIISTIISIISGYLFLRQPKERWYEYRKNAEVLKGILSLKVIDRLSDRELLKKAEGFFNKENENWYSKKEKKKEKNSIKTVQKKRKKNRGNR